MNGVVETTTNITAMIIYLVIGGFALLLALLSFIFSEIGDIFHDLTSPISDWASDHLSFGHDHDMGFSRFLNNGGILGFLAGFGFVAALAMSQFHASTFTAAGFGVLGGIVLGVFLGTIWYLLKRSEGTAGYSIDQLVGKQGVVVKKIFSDGPGEVKCSVNNMPAWYAAKTEDGSEILPGTTVRIIRFAGSLLYVAPEKI
jgi:membrane protein implicated in regulation of membrane protease activity